MKVEIVVDNINCGGCASTIQKELKTISGVESVTVEIENKIVSIEYNDRSLIDVIKLKLKSLGYPESGSVHGIAKVTTKTKSLVSCAVGKLGS
ncbi:MAG: heavy-metal-associated domain-containing protein [Bacteroidia bacterium]|nr:heavy-metal-associated domain-containing protein [Bacteroidia bacterium]